MWIVVESHGLDAAAVEGVTCPQGSHRHQRMDLEFRVPCEYVLKLTFPYDFDLVASTGYLLLPVHGMLVPIVQGFIVPTYGSIPERETCVTVPETAHKLVDCFRLPAVAVHRVALQFG